MLRDNSISERSYENIFGSECRLDVTRVAHLVEKKFGHLNNLLIFSSRIFVVILYYFSLDFGLKG
jgi:hypothetical protein